MKIQRKIQEPQESTKNYETMCGNSKKAPLPISDVYQQEPRCGSV